MRVGLYARVSTADKDQQPETQLVPMREFCSAQGWTIVGEFVDKASATDLRGRIAWRDLLDLASKRRLDVILCWKLDRCFRSTSHAANTLEKVRGWKVGLRSYTEAWADTTTPAGELMFTMSTAFAAFERDLIRERVRAGMARAKKQGKRLGRRGGTWAPDFEEKWSALEPALRAGEISHSEAARQLKVSRATVLRRLTVQRVVAQRPSDSLISEGSVAP